METTDVICRSQVLLVIDTSATYLILSAGAGFYTQITIKIDFRLFNFSPTP